MTTSRTGEGPVVAGRGGHVAARSSRGWRAVALAAAAGATLGTGGGALAAMARPVHYRATVQEYIRFTEDSGAPDPSGPQKVRSYAGMVRSQRVLEPVITSQRLKTTVDELAGKVTAVNPEGSLLVEISVTDGSSSTARTLAEAIGRQFGSTVSQLEGRTVVDPGSGQGTGQDGSAQGTDQGTGQGEGLPVTTATAVQVTAVGRSRLVKLQGSALPWLLGGGLLGLLAGAGVRMALRRRDPWIDEPTDLVPITGAAPLGIVDDPRGGRRGAGAAVNAARSIAANLRFSDVDHPPRCLVIAGAYADGAQTMVAADLAIGLARTGQKVVLVEADLAAFRLRQELRIDGRLGLTSILTGDSELDQVLVEWRDGVQVLPGGPLPPNPAQVMRSEQLASLLRVLKVRFDYVVLDGPPMLATPVAAELAARADGAVLVITRGELRAGEVREAVTALEQAEARLLGTIFCDAPLRDGMRRGALTRKTADPEAAPAEGRGYEPRGFETRSESSPRRQSGRGSKNGSRSLEEFDDPSIVPLLLASPEELGREVEALPRHDVPSVSYPAAPSGPPHGGGAGSGSAARGAAADTSNGTWDSGRADSGRADSGRGTPRVAAAQTPVTPRRVPLVQVPVPRADTDDDAGGAPEMVTLPPDDSYFSDLYEDTLPDDPFPPGRGSGGAGSGSRGGGPAWGTPPAPAGAQPASGQPGHGPTGQGHGAVGQGGQGGHWRYQGPDPQPRRDERPAARADLQRQGTLTEDPFPQVIPGPTVAPAVTQTPTLAPAQAPAPQALPTVMPGVTPSVGVAPTPAQTPPGGLSPSSRSYPPASSPTSVPVQPPAAAAPVAPVLPRPSLAPQPGALTPPHPSPSVGQVPAGYPAAPQGYPGETRPQLPTWAEMRREYEEPRPAYLDDPDLDRPYQPLRHQEPAAEQQPLPRRAATERHRHQEQYPYPDPQPQQVQPAQPQRPAAYQQPMPQPAPQQSMQPQPQQEPAYRAEPSYQQDPAYQQGYPQVQYGLEHVSEYGRSQDPVSAYPYPEGELPMPRRTVPPSMARPGMTVLPTQPQPGGSGRRRARDTEPEPFLQQDSREAAWGDQDGRDDGTYRPY